jgi:C4-dicarboxylate-specific signal transduction histidine kinase
MRAGAATFGISTNRDAEDLVEIDIHDAGAGRASDDIQKVFGIFLTTKANGLATCGSNTGQRGGRPWTKNNDNYRTAFRCALLGKADQ